jgi:DNA-binding transcriptional LysR family regulator
MAMTLQQLRVLVAVIDHRSFTRGARAAYMTQSAASQHVRALEGALGTSLVERTGGEVAATRAGEALVDYAREILRLADDAERRVSALRDGTAGRLTIGASGGAVYLVPTIAAGFRTAHPGIELALDVRPRDALRAAAAQGAVDVALLSSDGTDTPEGPTRQDVAIRVLCPDRLVLVAAPSSHVLPAAALAPLPLERVAHESLIATRDASSSWRLAERWALGHGVELRAALRLDNVDAVKKAVEAGIGLAFLSAWVVEREVAFGTLRVVPVMPEPPARRYELHYRAPRRAGDPSLDAFLRFAPDYLASRLPLGLAAPLVAA